MWNSKNEFRWDSKDKFPNQLLLSNTMSQDPSSLYKLGRTDNGNFILNSQEPMWDINSNKNKKGGYKTALYFKIPGSFSVTERKKFLQSLILRSLFTVNPKNYFKYKFPNEILLANYDWREAELTDLDKQILSRMYTQHRWFKLFVKYPLLFLDYFKKEYPVITRMIYDLNMFFLIALYFMFTINMRLVMQKVRNWWGFTKQAFFVCMAFVFVIIFQQIYWQYSTGANIFNELSSLPFMIVASIIGYMIISNVLYLIDIFIDKLNIGLYNKLFIKHTSWLLILGSTIIVFTSRIGNLDFVIEWTLFVLLVLGARALMMYHNQQIENAVKEKDLELAQLKAVRQQSELQAIHSRINPHFLYNSLNSIASLSTVSPEKTEKMALSLSRFFRFAINKKHEDFVPVKDELEVVESYLEIEKIRFGEKLRFNVSCSDKIKDIAIPRFVIQPLVENAIKHGVGNLVEEGIVEVEITNKDGFLKISVSDNGHDFPEEPMYGYGLQSIYEKLNLYYKGEASMQINKKPDKAIVLNIPLNTNSHA